MIQIVTKSSNNNPSATFSDSGGERCKYKCEGGFVILPPAHADDCPKQTGADAKLSISLD
jgi:hypothetical protein